MALWIIVGLLVLIAFLLIWILVAIFDLIGFLTRNVGMPDLKRITDRQDELTKETQGVRNELSNLRKRLAPFDHERPL